MKLVKMAASVGALGLTLLLSLPASAASDVSNNSAQSNQATGSTAAKVAATQTATIISNSATSGFTGGFSGGGFAPSGGGGGGFSPSGGGSGGGFSPSGGSPGKQGSLDARMTGKSGGGAGAQTGLWMQGLWSNIDKSEAFLETQGNVYSVVTGLDRRSKHLVGGLALGYEHINLDTVYNNGTYRADGYTVAPYGAITLSPQWTLDGSTGYTWLNYDTSRQNGAVTGSFDGGRWFVSSNVTGGFTSGNWRYQPKLGALYMKESQNGYTDSTGAAVESNAFAIGRVSGGGKMGYALGTVLPYAKLMGEWDFKTPNPVVKSNGQESEISTGGGVGGLGVEVNTRGLTTSLEVNNNSVFRQDLDVWSTVARFRLEF